MGKITKTLKKITSAVVTMPYQSQLAFPLDIVIHTNKGNLFLSPVLVI